MLSRLRVDPHHMGVPPKAHPAQTQPHHNPNTIHHHSLSCTHHPPTHPPKHTHTHTWCRKACSSCNSKPKCLPSTHLPTHPHLVQRGLQLLHPRAKVRPHEAVAGGAMPRQLAPAVLGQVVFGKLLPIDRCRVDG